MYGVEQEEQEISETDTEIAERVIAERLEDWRNQKDADYFDAVDAREITGRNSGGVHEVVYRVFVHNLTLPLSAGCATNLHELAEHLVAKDHFPPDVSSGIVIAGFGEKQHFPTVQHIEIGGVYGGKLKVRPYSLDEVSDENPSHIMAFAYKDMVHAFLGGLSSDADELLINAAAFIREMPSLALDAVTDLASEERKEAAEVVRRASVAMAGEFARNVLQGSMDRRAKIVRAVETLTIKELAHVASTLVGLSSFEQQMSLDRETVGGPVDVAVISKGDGFIWIDRKHYFRRDLNEHFFRNYDGGIPAVHDTADGED